jgi:hypothetical protein
MRTPVLIAAAALAACSPAPSDNATRQIATPAATAGSTAPAPVATSSGASPEATSSLSPSPSPAPPSSTGRLPPADAANRYVGRWATRESLCKSGTWRFEPQRLVTAGEVACDFDHVGKVPGGYDIAALCRAEGETSKDTIKLRFAQSAQAMLVQSKMWDVGLIYCGPG